MKTIPLLNTSNVIDMSHMFDNCISLEHLPIKDSRINFKEINSKAIVTTKLIVTTISRDLADSFKRFQ